MHERDQRRYDDASAIHDHGGQLIAKRLARARWHDRKRPLTSQNACNHLFLLPAKASEAEQAMQNIGWRGGGSDRGHMKALA
jgi:hypothetical protein